MEDLTYQEAKYYDRGLISTQDRDTRLGTNTGATFIDIILKVSKNVQITKIN